MCFMRVYPNANQGNRAEQTDSREQPQTSKSNIIQSEVKHKMKVTIEFEVDGDNEAMLTMAHQLAKRFGSVRIIIKEDSSVK